MRVGTVVKLKTGCLSNLEGTIGVCYETYNIGRRGGGSVIFANGNYDGFSPDEQKMFFEEIGFSKLISQYNFISVMHLSDDFDNGVFDHVFKGKMY